MAAVGLGGVLVFGAALVSKAKSPGGSPTSVASNPVSGSAKFAVISHGESVQLADHVGQGDEYTVFLFGADW